jgi:hypothetical protein
MATIELNDQFTNEWTVFEEAVHKYYDNDNDPNTPFPEITMNDCDGIIYKKINDKYYRRVLVDDTVNVKWFGAKGDGKTDDTEAIQKAIKSSHSVRFDRGQYIINSTINIPMEFSGLSISGSGSDIWDKYFF